MGSANLWHAITVGAIFLGGAVVRAEEKIPEPAQMPVEVVVSGRTSTLKTISIKNVGQTIPRTFSGKRVKNTAGFRWYVSKHYAFKTNYEDKLARHYLTLLELTFPHYVELFGATIPDLDKKRMAVTYARDAKSLGQAMKADGLSWNFGGGGITYEGYNAAYVFPSGGLLYHQRYILLHECTHLYQMCLTGNVFATPPWFLEGIADMLANHVWEEARQRLTVNVVDKPTINNFYDDGLRRFAKEQFTPSLANLKGKAGRDVGFLLVAYFTTDVDRCMKFRIWRDELFRLKLYNKYEEKSNAILQELFGSWKKLDADFVKWMQARRSSFHYVAWGWEQDGEVLMSYGFPHTGLYSQTDLLFLPKDRPASDVLAMDYPRSAPETTVLMGPVERGVAEPSIGCVIGFGRNPDRGQAGMGLGVASRNSLKVLMDAGQRLIIDATDWQGGKQVTDLPAKVRQALAANGHQAGLTIHIRKKSLEVTLRAGKTGQIQTCSTSLSLGEKEHGWMLARPMAVLSRGGLHHITPYLDVRRQPLPDLMLAAPANRWRNAGDPPLYALYRAAWRLGGKAPPSLVNLQQRMLEAADKTPATQQKALDHFYKKLGRVLEAIQASGAEARRVQDTLADLRRFGKRSRATK